MKVKELLSYGIQKLKDNKVQNPILDAQIILADMLKIPTWKLLTIRDQELDQKLVQEYKNKIQKRATGFPIAYITNKKEFFGLEFFVKEGVLIPRPETEILVEKTLEKLTPEKEYLGVDIGTGSGAIAIALLKERPDLKMVATDISETALKIAEKNARIHKVKNRLKLIKSNLFEKLKGYRFDFIVSNPPYISEEEYESLQREVKKEPVEALIAGKGGIEFYEKIITQSKDFLKPEGFIAFEIGYNQEKPVKDLLKAEGFKVYSYKDLQGIQRVVIGEKDG